METRSQFLHFDSASATYITDLSNTTGNTSNPYKALFPMNQSFRRIKRVYLKSCELPIGFSNIRTGSTNTLTFKLNGTIYTVTLPERNHTSITTLLFDLNGVCGGTPFGGSGITFINTVSVLTPYRLAANFTGTTVSTFNFIDTTLSKYILGFRSTDALIGGTVVNGTANYNLSADNYILMYVPSLNSMNANMGGQISTFKIPLLGFTNSVFYYFDGNSYQQWVDISDDNLVLSGLQVIIYDKWGQNLSPNGLDYSFTLQVEYYM